MEPLAAYIPMDRRQAMACGSVLPDHATGAALFADISGFTPLTEALASALGPRRGADELTRQLNLVYEALIAEVHHYGGSIIGFSGDAITCWFSDPFLRQAQDSSSGQAPSILRQAQDDNSGEASGRAIACALALQQVMMRFATIQAPGGVSVSLAIKVAIAAGPVRRFLVGDPVIQYIDVLAGATMDRMAAGEKHAQRGEVIIGLEIAAQLGGVVEIAGWRGEEDMGHRFAVVSRLRHKAQTSPWPALSPGTLTEEQIRAWLLPPVYERLRAGQGAFLAQLRPAAALFLRFGGLDYDEDPAAGAKLDVFVRWIQNVIARYEGYLLQLTTGDKGSYLYAAFGALVAHGDDAVRAVAAALELRSPPREMDFISSVQIGVSQGRMWTGAYGSLARCTYGVLGDEVNLAARLMSKAEAGQVLVSQRIADLAGKHYGFESLGAVAVKGKQLPVPIFAAKGELPAEVLASWTNLLVGRERELVRMEPLLQSVLASEGRILCLEGEAGVGKSRLAAEFAGQAAGYGLQVIRGTCQGIMQGTAYFPWRQIFHALMGLDESVEAEKQTAQIEAILRQVFTDWQVRLPLLGDLVGLSIPDNSTTSTFDARLRQEALFALAVELAQWFARRRSLLLLVEDVHWMDEASRGLTLALSRVIAQSPILLMLVQRPPTREDKPLFPGLDRLAYYHHLSLAELAPEGVAQLVANRLSAAGEACRVSALALSLIQARAQGNPFFVEELVDALRETGKFACQDGVWTLAASLVDALREANCLVRDASGEWVVCSDAPLEVAIDIPDSVHGAVLARLDRLPELPKLSLRVASVIGRVFERDVLARANPTKPGLQTLQAQLEVLEKRDFARLEAPPPHVVYMFKHNVTQEVVYSTLLDAQQRELHRAVGMAQEDLQPDAVEQLAHHFGRSDVRYKTLYYLDKAARRAQRQYANETALNYYGQALALEEFWEWRKGQIEVLHVLGWREQEQAALRVLETMPNAPAFDVAFLWGRYFEATSDYVQAQAAIERALALSREQANRVNQADCLALLGLIARRQGDYERAKNCYQPALALFHEDAAYSPEEAAAFAQALNGLGIVCRQQGKLEEARALYQRALDLSRQSGNRRGEAEAMNSLGVTAFYRRNFADALSCYQQAFEIQRAIGDRVGEGATLINLATAARDLGDYGQAETHFSVALAIQQAIGNRWEQVNIWNGLGVMHQELGRLARARESLEQGLALSQEIGDEAGQAYILANLGGVARDMGEWDEAEKFLARGLELSQKQADKYMMSYFLSHSAIVHLRAGQPQRSIGLANTALAMRQEADLRLWTTADLTTLAASHYQIGDIDAAGNYARRALDILDECRGEGPENPQQDYFMCYQVLQALGQADVAARALRSAYGLVMARAEKITDPALRQSFLENAPTNREIVRHYCLTISGK